MVETKKPTIMMTEKQESPRDVSATGRNIEVTQASSLPSHEVSQRSEGNSIDGDDAEVGPQKRLPRKVKAHPHKEDEDETKRQGKGEVRHGSDRLS